MTEIVQIGKKVLLLGDPSVGKTSLIRKYVYDKFDDKYISTLGTKITRKRLVLKHPQKDVSFELTMLIWDVMGQKEYEMLHQSAYMGSQGALIVCDTTRRETLDNLPGWVSSLFDITGDIPLIFIGNKIDLTSQRQFEYNDLIETVKGFNAQVLLTSAKTGENVDTAFLELGKNLLSNELK